MATPEPPVAFKDQCSILHDNVLYVYQPDAFQILPLKENATWSQEENGVSVTGATCVKGGVDGNGADPALYVVGGATNASTSNYSGLQRYSIAQKKWQTITPITAVTANRRNHGSVYLNASSSILIYGGTQNGDDGYSTETFLMLMYPPYRVQAYSSIAPPAIDPFLLQWDNDRAVMVGGSPTNQQIFTFHPDPGWLRWGVNLPSALPSPSTGQVSLQVLDDGTRILQTYYLNESPNRVTRNVLADPGQVVAPYGQTIGDQSSGNSRFFRRQQTTINNYPAYNNSYAPTQQRTDAVLATGGSLAAIVGGDANSSVAVFNTTGNTWVDPVALFGETQKPLTTSSSSTTSATATPTETPTQTSSAVATSSAAAAAAASDGQSNGLAILGGVLGGICGLAAILIILMLWLRSVKKRKRMEAASRNKQQPPYPNDKDFDKNGLEKTGSQPLSQQAQPMGRSPVPSAVISEPDSVAIFGARGEKQLDNQNSDNMQSYGGSKLNPNHPAINNNSGGFFKANNKTPMQISRPMLPDLGDYQDRPSIDLGKATPSTAPVLPPVGSTIQQKEEQRKTDEGWAKYFSEDPADKPRTQQDKIEPVRDSYAIVSPITPRFAEAQQSSPRPSTAKSSGGTGFWPGAGVPTPSSRAAKLPTRDSEGNLLNHSTVAMASPSLAVGHENPATRNMSVATPAQAKLSRADSISTDHSSHSSDDGYEDDEIDAYSDTRDSYQQNAWNPIGNTWSGPSQRPLRPPSVRIGASAFPPPPTNTSEKTMDSSGSGESSIPVFPMPAATLKRDANQPNFYNAVVHHPPTNPYANPYAHARRSSNTIHYNGGPPIQDYFGPPPDTATSQASTQKLPDSTDMSWLNLGTPAHHGASPANIHGASHAGDAKDPA